MELPRLHVARAATFNETAEDVWSRIGNFYDVSWMPGVERVNADEPAQIREVYLQGGGSSVSEKLLSATPHSHTFTFTDPGALPVKDYLAVLRVHEDNGAAVVTWTAEFGARDATDEAAKAQMVSWYEACLQNAGGVLLSPLSLNVFVSDYKPIGAPVPEWDVSRQATWPASTATLISGERDAVLVDALITVNEVDELVAWIEATGKNLTTVYVTHGHADHFLGLQAVLRRYPDAMAIALPEVIPFADGQLTEGYLAYWESLFPGQLPTSVVGPEALESAYIDLEGHSLVPIAVGQSDTDPSTVVYVRDLDAVVGGDVAYNGIHLWLAQADAEARKGWDEALNIVESYSPAWVVAGHRDPSSPSDAAPTLIEWTRGYLRDFGAGTEVTSSTEELVAFMSEKYPSLGNPYTLTASSAAQFTND